jgi:hypothetical protein
MEGFVQEEGDVQGKRRTARTRLGQAALCLAKTWVRPPGRLVGLLCVCLLS